MPGHGVIRDPRFPAPPSARAPPSPVPPGAPPITFSCFSLRTPSATPPPSQRGISHNAVFPLLLFLLLLLLLDVQRFLFSFSLNDRRSGATRLFFKFPVHRNARRGAIAKVLTVLFGVSLRRRGGKEQLGERQVRFPRR